MAIKKYYSGLVMLSLIIFSVLCLIGCQIQKTEAQVIVKECRTTGSFQNDSFCEDDICKDGIPYFIALECALKAAEITGKEDTTKGRAICDEWFKIDEEHFKDSFMLSHVPIDVLVNCYYMSGNGQYRAEAMCANKEGYSKDSCIRLARFKLNLSKKG